MADALACAMVPGAVLGVLKGRWVPGYNENVFSIRQLHSLIASAIIVAMLGVAFAPAWHQHDPGNAPSVGDSHGCCHHDTPGHRDHSDDQDDQDHHDCPVCVAVHAPTGSGLPGGVRIVLAQILIGFAQATRYNQPVVRFLPVLWSCGPPVTTA